MSTPNEIKAVRARRRPRKQLQTPNPEVRRRLIDAAMELIREQGFPELRVEEVATKAGLSVGTFYLYFDGKDDLYVTLVVEYTERLRARRRDAHRGSGPVLLRLRKGMRAYLDFVEESEKAFLYFRGAGSLETNFGDLSSWVFACHAEDLQPLLEEGMRSGELPRRDPELLAQSMLGMMQHLAGYWLQKRDRISREALEDFIVGLHVAESRP